MNKIVFKTDSKYTIDLSYISVEDAKKIIDFLDLSKSKSWIVTIESEEDKRTEGIN